MKDIREYFKNILKEYKEDDTDLRDYYDPASGAVSELIYHNDCYDIFNKFEDDIIDILVEYQIDISLQPNFQTVAVWTVWELLFFEIYEDLEGEPF